MTTKRLILHHPPEADTHPHLPVDNGKNDDGVGRWVPEDKHRLLATYIDAARAAARKKFSHWVYIDPFCGPGRMQVRGEMSTRPGGAMVAWRQSQVSGTPFGRILIGDLLASKAAACEQRLQAKGAPVKAFVGPAAKTVHDMVAAVPRGSLCLAYLDPYNLSLLSHSMIEALAKLQKIDFVVHFSTMDLYRNADHALDPDRARFDEVSPGWRQRVPAASNKANLADRLFLDWHDQIKKLGFSFSEASPPILNSEGREIYRLAFFARHPLPIGLWSDVARDPNRDLF